MYGLPHFFVSRDTTEHLAVSGRDPVDAMVDDFNAVDRCHRLCRSSAGIATFIRQEIRKERIVADGVGIRADISVVAGFPAQTVKGGTSLLILDIAPI